MLYMARSVHHALLATVIPGCSAHSGVGAGSVASTVTLSATVLEALRVMLAGLEQPGGSLASSLSGDARTVAQVTAAAALSVPVATAVAFAMTHAAGAASPRSMPTAPGAIWLAAAAVGVQLSLAVTHGAALLVWHGWGRQHWVATLVLAAGGAAAMWGLMRQQAQMLRVAAKRAGRDGQKSDIEAFETPAVRIVSSQL